VPMLKTYSRKKKVVQPARDAPTAQADKKSSGPPSVKLLPPNYSTLVGLRGLLLHQRSLQQAVCDSDDRSGIASRRYRPDTYKTLAEGIYNPDILDTGVSVPINSLSNDEDNILEPIENNDGMGPLTERQADELLFQRLKALFFWPAVMTCTK